MAEFLLVGHNFVSGICKLKSKNLIKLETILFRKNLDYFYHPCMVQALMSLIRRRMSPRSTRQTGSQRGLGGNARSFPSRCYWVSLGKRIRTRSAIDCKEL